MKKTTSLMLVLLFSAVMLLGEAINTTFAHNRKLCCQDLLGCGGTECCPGRGSAFGCNMVCESGLIIICRGDVDKDN